MCRDIIQLVRVSCVLMPRAPMCAGGQRGGRRMGEGRRAPLPRRRPPGQSGCRPPALDGQRSRRPAPGCDRLQQSDRLVNDARAGRAGRPGDSPMMASDFALGAILPTAD